MSPISVGSLVRSEDHRKRVWRVCRRRPARSLLRAMFQTKRKKERKNRLFAHLMGVSLIDGTQHVWPSGQSSVCSRQSGSNLQSVLQQRSASHESGQAGTGVGEGPITNAVGGRTGVPPDPKNLPKSVSPGRQLPVLPPSLESIALVFGGSGTPAVLHVPPNWLWQRLRLHSASWLSMTPLQLWSLPSAQFTGAPGKVVASLSSQSLPHGPLRKPSRSASTLHASSSQSVCMLQSLSWPSEQAVTKSCPVISDAKSPSCCLHSLMQSWGGFGPNSLSGPTPHAAWQHPTSYRCANARSDAGASSDTPGAGLTAAAPPVAPPRNSITSPTTASTAMMPRIAKLTLSCALVEKRSFSSTLENSENFRCFESPNIRITSFDDVGEDQEI